VELNAAVMVSAGALLVSGKAPRLASLALAGSLVPTTLAGHAYWEHDDPRTRSAHKVQLLKHTPTHSGGRNRCRRNAVGAMDEHETDFQIIRASGPLWTKACFLSSPFE
jgi:uncharacterized membrane protein YphA (DoxX/SURF4 family)